jgi:hypothetical protein
MGLDTIQAIFGGPRSESAAQCFEISVITVGCRMNATKMNGCIGTVVGRRYLIGDGLSHRTMDQVHHSLTGLGSGFDCRRCRAV